MSDQATTATVERSGAGEAAGLVKRQQTEQVLAEILERMEWPAGLELKDAEDGGISVALHSKVEIPGLQTGKKSPLVDALQLVVNKIVNRPGTERRWVTIGVGEHPAPRAPDRAAKKPAAAAAARGAAPVPVAGAAEQDEKSLSVSPDPALEEVARLLARRSAERGRYYAIFGMKREDRARVIQASASAENCRVIVEGEGRQRRVVFNPAKPMPMPKRMFPIDDDEDEALTDAGD